MTIVKVPVDINYSHWKECISFLRLQDKPKMFPWVTDNTVFKSTLLSFILLYDYVSDTNISGVNKWYKQMYTPAPDKCDVNFILKLMKYEGFINKLGLGSHTKKYDWLEVQKEKCSYQLDEKKCNTILKTGLLYDPYICKWNLFDNIKMLSDFRISDERDLFIECE